MDTASQEIQRELDRIRPDLRDATEAKLAEPGAERPEAENPAWAAVVDAAFNVEADRLLGPSTNWGRAKRFAQHIGESLLRRA